MKTYYLAAGQHWLGPFDEATLAQRVANGETAVDDLCWTEGMSDWQPIRSALPDLHCTLPPQLAVPGAQNTQAGSIGSPRGHPANSEAGTSPDGTEAAINSGATWAIWFGIAKIGLSILLILLVVSTQSTVGGKGVADAVWNICVGALLLSVGLRIRKPELRKSSHFTVLIVACGISLAMHVVSWVAMSADGGKPKAPIIPILTGFALWEFYKGRRALKRAESEFFQRGVPRV